MTIQASGKRSIIRHLAQTNLSGRRIAELTGVSPGTVEKLRTQFTLSGKSWEELAALSDSAFLQQLDGLTSGKKSNKVVPDWAYVQKELEQRDMTLSLLHHEYMESLASEPERALRYSQFTALFRRWQKTQRVSMRQFHFPGDKMFIDFCGKTMPVVDPNTGVIEYAQIFVAVLGASGFTFAFAVPSQKIPDWLLCHVQAFEFFGGVVRQLVPDNLKSAVIKHTSNQLILNRSYADLADHYGCVINPARSRKPKDKSLAEVSVQIFQRWALASLRKRKFFSYADLNEAIALKVADLNEKTSVKYPMSRRERFETLDRPALLPLPIDRFELSRHRYKVRVSDDYHVEYEGSFYSVPYEYIQHHVDLRATRNVLEVMLDNYRIASHPLRASPGKSSLLEHMPMGHQQQQQDEPDMLLKWAEQVGENTHEWVRQNLELRRDYANGLKSARKLRRFVREEQNVHELESACQFALQFNLLGFTRLKTVLAQKTYLQPKPDTSALVKTHENVRGPDYYRVREVQGEQSC